MANVLGELFEDIASAIREKTNDGNPMKPSEFPEKIRNLESDTDAYNLSLAEMMMCRDTDNFTNNGSNSKKLSLRGFKTSEGNTLASLQPYSFAGFDRIEGIEFTDSIYINSNVFYGCERLKILDFTLVNNSIFNMITFLNEALNGCPSLESIIVRDGGFGVSSVFFRDGATTGSNKNFYVYVPSKYYNTIISNLNSEVSASRFRKLENYPEIDGWYNTY